jgi:hypothetical protein
MEGHYDELREHNSEIMYSEYGTTGSGFLLAVSCVNLVIGPTTEQRLAFRIAIPDHDRSRGYRAAMYADHGTESWPVVRAVRFLAWRFKFFQELETTTWWEGRLKDKHLIHITSMIIANGTQQATAQHMPTKLIITVALSTRQLLWIEKQRREVFHAPVRLS